MGNATTPRFVSKCPWAICSAIGGFCPRNGHTVSEALEPWTIAQVGTDIQLQVSCSLEKMSKLRLTFVCTWGQSRVWSSEAHYLGCLFILRQGLSLAWTCLVGLTGWPESPGSLWSLSLQHWSDKPVPPRPSFSHAVWELNSGPHA